MLRCGPKRGRHHVTEAALEHIAQGQQDSFFVFDLQSVRDRVNMWRDLLPEVEIYYSFKTNSDHELVKTMHQMGTKFDCASMGEIKTAMSLGIKPEDILYANPCKPHAHIAYAKEAGVKIMTFDCAEEAEKIADIYPEAELILRIVVDDRNAADPMSGKFGAKHHQWSNILDTCKRRGMRVRGVSFHVGSGGCSANEYTESIFNAKTVFEMAVEKGMPEMDILDIGGGFTMSSTDPERNFDFVAPRIN